MIRLYPQVIKSEENIQDLLRVLNDIQHENHDRCGQLLDAGRRIEDVGAELRQAESERSRRRQEARNVRQAEKGLRERVQGQRAAGDDLQRLLACSQAGHQKQLQSLAASECESKECWDMLAERDADLEAVAMQIKEQSEAQRRLQDMLSKAEASQRRLSREYRLAEASAATRRCELREAGLQSEEHSMEASGHEAEERELLDQLEKIESLKRSLNGRLSSLDRATPDSENLRKAVAGSNFHLEQLRSTLDRLEPDLGELQQEFARSMQRMQFLEDTFSSEDAEYEALRGRLGAVTQQNFQLVAEIESAREESCELRDRLSSSEQDAQRLETKLRDDLDRCTDESQELETRGDQLERDLRQQHHALQALEAKKQEMLAVLAEREREKVELLERHQDIDRDYQLEKERCRCVVS